MDYWIGDSIITPAKTDHYFSETVWRLPRIWVSYDGKTEAPDSRWQSAADGTLWLGSFNNLGKITSGTITLWSKILHSMPEARLLLKTKALAEEKNRQRILDAFTIHGIGPERIELQSSRITPNWTSHMAYYDRLDIALDPVNAVCGGTTTCDALWMGVPVVSLVGDRMASRMTASMLDALGRSEWIATSEEEYMAKVVELASDVEGRKAIRANQRKHMASSPLCDAKGLAQTLETAFEAMFERWLLKNNKVNLTLMHKELS
jgi:predicted O-linked N-acetylglucosamine transferase (SPINDLY family)